MGYTKTRVQEWTEVMGADGEKIFAVGGAVSGRFTANSAGGNVFLYGDTVPPGTLWVLYALNAWDGTRAISSMNVMVYRNGLFFIIEQIFNPAANQIVNIKSPAILFPGDQPSALFVGTLAGDGVNMTYLGYSMVMP